jgi:hypothetical protein
MNLSQLGSHIATLSNILVSHPTFSNKKFCDSDRVAYDDGREVYKQTHDYNFHAVFVSQELFRFLLIDDFWDLPVCRVSAVSTGAAVFRFCHEEVVTFDAGVVRHEILKLPDSISNHLQKRK